jgi:hypothetical protein
MKKLQGAGVDNAFLWINPVEMYTIFSAVLRQQGKSDVMTYFGHSARSAVYYKAGYPLQPKIMSAVLLELYASYDNHNKHNADVELVHRGL